LSQRGSGYARKERDLYETPEWVTLALLPHIPERVRDVWEPACGSGKMVRALNKRFLTVYGTDIDAGRDFLMERDCDYDAIITNPPYALATEFIERAISICSFVAMLLRTDFDHAKTRLKLFGPGIAKKLVLTRRIKWFEDSKGQPSFNHAWFIWDREHSGPPALAYH
jgi:hypothetical protein